MPASPAAAETLSAPRLTVPVGLCWQPAQQAVSQIQKVGQLAWSFPESCHPVLVPTQPVLQHRHGTAALAGQELGAGRLSQGGGVSLGFLGAEHHQGIVFYWLCSGRLFQNKVIHYDVHSLPVVYHACSNPSTELHFCETAAADQGHGKHHALGGCHSRRAEPPEPSCLPRILAQQAPRATQDPESHPPALPMSGRRLHLRQLLGVGCQGQVGWEQGRHSCRHRGASWWLTPACL